MEQIQKRNIPDKPTAEIQKMALQYIIVRPSYSVCYLEGIDPALSFTHPYNLIFEAARDLTHKGNAADNLAGGIFLHLAQAAKGNDRAAASAEMADIIAHTFPEMDAQAAADIVLKHTKDIQGEQYANELCDIFADPLTTQEQRREKVEQIQKHINSLQIARVAPVSISDKSATRDFLLIDDKTGFGTLATGNVYQIAGLPKSGKSKMAEILTASCIGCNMWGLRATRDNIKTLIFDTEMDIADDVEAMRRINALTGLDNESDHFDRYQYYNITEEDEMLNVIIERVQAEKPDLVIIDGINDLLADPNDLATSKAIIKRLNQFSKTAGGIGKPICIVWLLHLNQSEGATAKKAGGHSGSQSTMKVAGGWIVSRDEDTGIISIINNVSRTNRIAPIYVNFDEDGNIYNAETEYNETIATAAEYAEQQAERRKELNAIKTRNAAKVKAFDFCKSLDIWNGAPIDRDTFFAACMPVMNNNKSNVSRKLKTLIEQGIISACEDGLYNLNVLKLEEIPDL